MIQKFRDMPGIRFCNAYIKSMRLYYSFVTGIAGWIGVAYYEYIAGSPAYHTVEITPSPIKKFIILGMLFMSWGINQIINDYLGLKEDRINAPHRPMVTGELNPNLALALTFFLLVVTGFITWFYLQPVAVIFLAAGVLLNVVYEFAKGYGIMGNIVFGLMITMATLFGGYACGPTQVSALESHRFTVILLIWLINGLMTYYTYFKDYQGDKAAGKNTLIVKHGIQRSRLIALISAFLPTIALIIFKFTGLLWIDLNNTFLLLWGITIFLQIWTGALYFLNPVGKQTYYSLQTNFRACACGQAALIALFDPDLAIWLFMISYIFVGFLFELHSNPRG